MYVRKVKKGGKTYLYYYKSQRIGNKVKSIYVGKVLEKPAKPSKLSKPKLIPAETSGLKPTKNISIINSLLEFDKLIFEVNNLITNKDLKTSVNVYNKMLELYSKMELHVDDKQKVFNKLSSIYNELVNLSKEYKIE